MKASSKGRLLTAAETAERRRKTPQALVMERQRNTGPPYLIDGGRVLYPENELEAWLQARIVVPRRPRRESCPAYCRCVCHRKANKLVSPTTEDEHE